MGVVMSPDQIESAVATEFHVSLVDMKGTPRFRELMDARQTAWILLRYYGLSYPSIGRRFDRTHATILYGIKTVGRHIEREPKLKARFEKLINICGFSVDPNLIAP